MLNGIKSNGNNVQSTRAHYPSQLNPQELRREFLIAVDGNNIEKVGQLLKSTPSLINDPLSETGATALLIAVDKGHMEMINVLIERGANLQLANNHGLTPFFTAVIDGRLDIAQTLLEHGADVNMLYQGATPLWVTTKNGFKDMVALLLQYGADANAGGTNNSTPLRIAAENNHHEIAALLLQNGADFKIEQNTHTPLSLAALMGHTDTVKTIMDHAGTLHTDEEIATALSFAVYKVKGATISAILKHPRNASGEIGRMVLRYAVEQGSVDAMAILVQSGLDPNLIIQENIQLKVVVPHHSHKKKEKKENCTIM